MFAVFCDSDDAVSERKSDTKNKRNEIYFTSHQSLSRSSLGFISCRLSWFLFLGSQRLICCYGRPDPDNAEAIAEVPVVAVSAVGAEGAGIVCSWCAHSDVTVDLQQSEAIRHGCRVE